MSAGIRLDFGCGVGVARFNQGAGCCDPPSRPGARLRLTDDPHRVGEGGDPATRVVVVGRRVTHDNRLDAGALDDGGNLAAERGVTEHDDPLHAVPEVGGFEQFAIRDDEVRSEVRSAGDFREQRGSEFAGNLFGAGASAGSCHDDGAGSCGELERLGPVIGRCPVIERVEI